MNYLLERTFENRGYEDGFFDKITATPHGFPKDTDKFCEELAKHYNNRDLIVLLTDFDNDGLMCGIEGYAGFAEMGFRVALFTPVVTDGYGFNADTIKELIKQYPEVKCIVTADVGITCYEGIAYAKSQGINVLVTDHHLPSMNIDATVWVDPTRKDEVDGYAESCGAVVLYQVMEYFAMNYLRNNFIVSQIQRLRVFAGCGTVSDSMPMYFENRGFVADAITIFKLLYSNGDQNFVNGLPGCDIYRRAMLGIYAVMKVYADHGNAMLQDMNAFNEDFIGFYFAPAMNSIKRMGCSVMMAYEIFFGADPIHSVDTLLNLNDERKLLVDEKFSDLREGKFPQPWAPYIFITDADGGIRGLLAQKMMEMTGEPVMVMGYDGDGYSGSGRCPSWYPFQKYAISDKWYSAGHQVAFGIGCDDEDGMDALYEHLKKDVADKKPSPEELNVKPDFVISSFNDGDANLDAELLMDYVSELSSMRPFGPGFEEPVALLKVNSKECEFSLIGKTKDHVKIKLGNGISALCWFQGHLIKENCHLVRPDKDDENHMYSYYMSDTLPFELELKGKFEFNTYNNNTSLQFVGRMTNVEV